MSRIITIGLLLTFLLASNEAVSQGYEIKVKIPNLKGQQVLLGHRFSKQLLVDDTIVLNKKGEGILKGKEKLKEGMYFLSPPSNKFFDFFIGKNQKFTVENDTVDLLKNLKITGDKENALFIDYRLFLEKQQKASKELSDEYKNSKDEKRKKEIQNEYKKINEAVVNKQNTIIEKNADLFISKFLKATQEIKIPENITDQGAKYYFYRNNFFTYFDYKDQRLLRTPFYQDKLNYYLEKVVPQAPDTLIKEVDILIENSRHDKELFRFMLVHLFNKYTSSQIMGMENVWVHIADKYYIDEAEWSDKEYIEELKEKKRRAKPALLGKTAPELKMIMLPKDESSVEAIKDVLETLKESGNAFIEDSALIAEKMEQYKSNYPNLGDSALQSRVIISELAQMLESQLIPNFDDYISVHDEATKYTILYFWAPDCSHCKKETPKFSKAYDEKKMKDYGLTVIPVYLHKNINEWEKYTKHINTWLDFVLEHNMLKWTNVWEPFGYSHFRDLYNISSQPVLYLLDKDKKIIAKRISYEQAFDLIKEIEKNEKAGK